MNDAASSGLVWVSGILAGTLAATALLGCGGGAASGAPAGSPEAAAAQQQGDKPAFDLEATIKREAENLADTQIADPAGAWNAKVPAAGAPTISMAEDIALIEIPIGSKAAVRCQVFAETVDPAGLLHSVIKDSSGKVEYRSIAPSGVHIVAGAPAAFLDTLYLSEAPGGKAAGSVKMAIQAREARSLLCIHDELGYRKTFERISLAFFASFKETNAAKSAATYMEISKVRLDDVDVGFSVSRLLPAEKPALRQYVSISSSFIPTSPKDVMFEDSYTILSLGKANQLLSGTWVEGSAGEITLKIGLERDDKGKYTYQGEVSGKPLQGELKVPKGLSTSLDIAAVLKKKLKAGGAFAETLHEYHPSIDPTATIPVKYSHAKGAPARQVVVQMGERSFTAEVDDDGMPKSGSFEFGKRRMLITREQVDGHL